MCIGHWHISDSTSKYSTGSCIPTGAGGRQERRWWHGREWVSGAAGIARPQTNAHSKNLVMAGKQWHVGNSGGRKRRVPRLPRFSGNGKRGWQYRDGGLHRRDTAGMAKWLDMLFTQLFYGLLGLLFFAHIFKPLWFPDESTVLYAYDQFVT